MQILDQSINPSQIFFLTSHQIFSFSVPLPSGHIWVNWTCPSAVVYHALRNFLSAHEIFTTPKTICVLCRFWQIWTMFWFFVWLIMTQSIILVSFLSKNSPLINKQATLGWKIKLYWQDASNNTQYQNALLVKQE